MLPRSMILTNDKQNWSEYIDALEIEVFEAESLMPKQYY